VGSSEDDPPHLIRADLADIRLSASRPADTIAFRHRTASRYFSAFEVGLMARLIDPRGHRFGAGLSVVILAAGFLAQVALVVPAIAAALGVSAVSGTRYSILGRPWPTVRRILGLAPPAELESEFPPRFAQLLGAAGLILATLLLGVGQAGAGWLVAGAVAALQLLLAATGYCIGCHLYGLRWYAPGLFNRLIALSSHDTAG
jgi:hypothetical protein